MKEKIFPREITKKLLKWLPRRECYAIRGPRQSGKTTLLKVLEDKLKKQGKNIVFLNFEDYDILEAFEKNPKEFIKSFLTTRKKYFFLMDEYHYVKDGGKKLKLLYDTFENIKFIITGSSSLEISGAMAKFLVGRVFFFELLPFNFYEFLNAKDERLAKIYEKTHKQIVNFLSNNKDFKLKEDIFLKELLRFLNEYAVFGGYPAVIKAKDKETKIEILKNIYNTYISKDIVEFLKFSDALKYRDVVKVLALSTGNLINYQEICSDTNTYYHELRKIISILLETYIISLIKPFCKNPRTEIKKIPKLYFFDLGLKNYIIENFNNLEIRQDRGEIAENLVFLALRRMFPEASINYWRTIAKAEVDFVLRIKNEIIPIEVKFQNLEKPKISRSLRSFIETYKPKKVLVITKDLWAEKNLGKTKIKFIPIVYL